ncbi:sel1 repeat family protein [Candidatus Peregrinibacteria bacterium]|nr:sel1 repeat family protein [Candidatus Peregrinibacteria bacterium]
MRSLSVSFAAFLFAASLAGCAGLTADKTPRQPATDSGATVGEARGSTSTVLSVNKPPRFTLSSPLKDNIIHDAAAHSSLRGPQQGLRTASSRALSKGKLDYASVLELAMNGNHDAEFELGAMFHDGDGVGRDFGKALEWYRKAASAGNRQAAFNLGLMLQNGEGAGADPDAARNWFIRASDAGDARGALQLGTMAYAEKDYSKALSYFLKSAGQGLADAQMNVGIMHIRGEGVPSQDLVGGYAWLTLSKEGGNQRAAAMLDGLSGKMTEEQKMEGKAKAQELGAEVNEAVGD